MSKTHILMAAALLALAGGVHAADDAGVKTNKAPTLSGAANQQLRQDEVPSVKTDPQGAESVKAKADADLAARDARDKGPRLQVSRQNLKGPAAAQAIRAQTTPNTIDHDTAYGDKDHTEQVTNLKVQIKR